MANPRVVVAGKLPEAGPDVLRATNTADTLTAATAEIAVRLMLAAERSVARCGAIADAAALTDALRSGLLAAEGLDVYETEPDVPRELRKLPNTVLLPHVGSATGTRDAMARPGCCERVAVIEGREPPPPVV